MNAVLRRVTLQNYALLQNKQICKTDGSKQWKSKYDLKCLKPHSIVSKYSTCSVYLNLLKVARRSEASSSDAPLLPLITLSSLSFPHLEMVGIIQLMRYCFWTMRLGLQGNTKQREKQFVKNNNNPVVINFEISSLKSNILFLKVVLKCEQQDNKSLSKATTTTTTHKDPWGQSVLAAHQRMYQSCSFVSLHELS